MMNIITERETVDSFLHQSRRSWWTQRPSQKPGRETTRIKVERKAETSTTTKKIIFFGVVMRHFLCVFFFAWFSAMAADLFRLKAFKVLVDWFWHWNRQCDWVCLSTNSQRMHNYGANNSIDFPREWNQLRINIPRRLIDSALIAVFREICEALDRSLFISLLLLLC